MNVMGEKFKDKKNGVTIKQFAFIVGSCAHFRSSRVHNMSAKSAIEKLQRIVKEKEMQRNEHKWRQEEEMELLKSTTI